MSKRPIIPFALLSFRCLLAIAVIQSCEQAEARNIFVDGRSSGGDGVSWATAFHNIGDAVNASASGDSVWVASGTYYESLTLKEGVSLFGGFRGIETGVGNNNRDLTIYKSIINATGLNGTVIQTADYSTLDGFTIMNGHASKLGEGGGITIRHVDNVIIRNCRIVENESTYSNLGAGGGIYADQSSFECSGSSIVRNAAYGGGGFFIINSIARISSCLIDENTIDGGMSIRDSDIILKSCTFGLRNKDFLNPEASDLDTTSCFGIKYFENCIIRRTDSSLCGDDFIIRNSNIPGFPGNGNIDEDPQWADPENGDYRLKPSSPCIDSGTVTTGVTDLDGNPRPVDVVGVGRDGPGAFDMGCYEFQLSPADLTRNGKVDAEDLIEFQSQWMSEGE